MTKIQTQKISKREFDATYKMLCDALNAHGIPSYPTVSTVTATLDGDLIPVGNINDARWLFTKAFVGTSIIKIGNDGQLIRLVDDL